MAKILYSPGFGAGWSTWCYGEKEEKIFFLTYQPLIDAIENGNPTEFDNALKQFEIDFEAKFGEGSCGYLGGASDLCVYEVNVPFKICEYDGSESVEYPDDASWFDPSEF
jgi:hypothetical protein